MTIEQMKIFISAAQMGYACGLENPIEWFENYDRTLDMWCRYEDIEEKSKESLDAFVAFFKKCSSCPEDELNDDLSNDKFIDHVNRYYLEENIKNRLKRYAELYERKYGPLTKEKQ